MNVSFARETLMRAWLRSEAKCECKRMGHGHSGRCNKAMVWANRGREAWGAWEAESRDNRSDTSLSNCEIICWSCHSHKLGTSGTHGSARPASLYRS
jgi:hypothetical protein